jgi:hypothetical protein
VEGSAEKGEIENAIYGLLTGMLKINNY